MKSSVLLHTLQSCWKNRIPGQLIIQITDACNARCPQCGMRVTEEFKRSRLPVDHIKRIIDRAAETGIQAISFTGGEPLLYWDDLLQLIQHAGKSGIPYIRTGTNGFLFLGSEKKGFYSRVERIAIALADSPIRNFWISIDSAVPEVHERMRGLPGVIRGIQRALPIFHGYGIYPSVNLGINRNLAGEPPEKIMHGSADIPEMLYRKYRSGFEKFYRFVCDLGFTIVNCCYPMSIDPDDTLTGLSAVYAATARNPVVNFSRTEKAMIFKALSDTIPLYRSQIRIFTPRTSLLALYRQSVRQGNSPYPCRGGIDFFFIPVNGHVYPCGYRGAEDMGRFETGNSVETISGSHECHACDWECFRDPSELMGLALDLLNKPVAALKRLCSDHTYARLWAEDLWYYRACGFFDGRKAPEWSRMHPFSKGSFSGSE